MSRFDLGIVLLMIVTITSFSVKANAQGGIISTIAGNGDFSFSGDGSSATDATLGNPEAVVVDSEGNVFIADTGNNRIRKIDTSGIITTFAEIGAQGLFIDTSDNLYVASGFDGISKIDTSGNITTIVDTATIGFIGFEGVFVDSTGNIFAAEGGNGCFVDKIDNSGTFTRVAGNDELPCLFFGDDMLATSTAMSFPESVIVDNEGNLIIADTKACRIRKVDASGIITTIVGNGVCGFIGDGPATSVSLNRPSGIFSDNEGNIFFADTDNHRIRKLDTSGIVTTVAGTGNIGSRGDGFAATVAELNSPEGVFVDSEGNIFIADTFNNRIRKITAGEPDQEQEEGIISTIAGNGNAFFDDTIGPATDVTIGQTDGIFVDSSGNLFFSGNACWIRKVDTSGIITRVAGRGFTPECGNFGDGGPATDAGLNFVTDTFFDNLGNMFLADFGNNRIRVVDSSGIITNFAGEGKEGLPGKASKPALQLFSALAFPGDGGPATEGELVNPSEIFIDNAGNLFITELSNNIIRKVDASGIISTFAGTGEFRFSGDGGPAIDATFFGPQGIFGDSAGNIFVSDTGNNRIRKIDSSGIITTVAGTGNFGFFGDGGPATEAELATPKGLYIDNADNMFIADTDNNRIRKIDSSGIITTIAGSGARDFFGDGGPATLAALNLPSDVYGDTAGNIYIADTMNNRVRKVSFGAEPTPTPDVTPQPTPSQTLTPTTTVTPTPTPPSGKRFTFNCDRDFEMGRTGLERLDLNVGESENCILRLTNSKAGVEVKVLTKRKLGLKQSIKVEPEEGITDNNGVIEFAITAINRGRDWVAWAVANENGKFEFNREAYDTGNAWGLMATVKP